MSKAEIERFVALIKALRTGGSVAEMELLGFVITYEQPLTNALRFYAADK